MTPLILLDVDGVLNALADDGENDLAWREWRHGSATADSTAWPIVWAPEVIGRLRAWHDSGRVEIQWLTTWGHEANNELRELLGLPELAVAGTYQDEDESGAGTDAGSSHASVAPSAPDALSGRWWKYDVVRRLLAEQPDRELIWIDDELQPGSAFRRWADEQPLLHAVGPDPAVGLSSDDLRQIAWLLEPDSDSCVRCGGRLVPIAYGYPSYQMFEAAERGEIVLGGCMVFEGQPTQRCVACDASRATRGGA
jgi:hypothetical protein